MIQTKQFKGFTLIELIVVIGIIAILAAIVIVAVNPGRQFAQARNSQRNSDIRAYVNAVNQYAADNGGTAIQGFAACAGAPAPYDLATMRGAEDAAGDAAWIAAATGFDITAPRYNTGGANSSLAAIIAPDYISALPSDPNAEASEGSAYGVCLDGTRVVGFNRNVEAGIPAAQQDITIVQ